MTAKEFLQQGWHIEQRIEKRKDERERLMTKLTNGVQQLSGMPRGGVHDWTDTAIKIAELDKMLMADIDCLVTLKADICKAIDAVEDMRYRRLLELRYRHYESWEQIAVDMGYDIRWVYRLHGEALNQVKF